MSQAPLFGSGASPQGMFNKSERNRLIFMSVLFVAVVGIFATSLMKKSDYEQEERAGTPATAYEDDFVENVVVPEFEGSLIAGSVADTRPDDRVLLESEPFDALFTFARNYGDNVFRGGKGVTLEPAVYDALTGDPAAHRANPYRVRGTIEEVTTRKRPDGVSESRGWLELEDGRYAAFAIEELPESLMEGSFVRVDGFFLKLFRGELGDEWVEGPMLVGRAAERSYPAPPTVFDPESLAVALVSVRDDSVKEMTMLDDSALKAQWQLLDLARRDDVPQPDWDNPAIITDQDLLDLQELQDQEKPIELPARFDGKVIELTNGALAALHKWPALFRGRPFHLPISKNMGSHTAAPKENAARLDAITTGWIANTTWTSNTGLIQYVMPGEVPDMRDATLTTGRGYFLKKLAYEPSVGDLALCPLFVMESVEPFVPVKDVSVDNFMWIVLGAMLLLVVLIPILLLRDRKRSAALQQELTRRRQERRSRQKDVPAPANPVS